MGEDLRGADPAEPATAVVGEDARMAEEVAESREPDESGVDESVIDDAAPDVETEEAGVEVEDLPGPAPRNVLVPALGAALAIAVAGAGFLGWQVWEQSRINQAREDVQRTAVSYAEVLTSVDSNQVDENFRQILDGATGEFKDMYSKSSVELRQLLIENKATAHGVVVESAVQSVSTDKAVVLLFVDQSVSNMKLPDPRIDRSRMKMTLEKVDGRWRASKVELP